MRVAGVESRSDRPQNVDFSALAQMLRTIGGYLDQRKASLHKITNNEFSVGEPVFRIEYESAEREVLSESAPPRSSTSSASDSTNSAVTDAKSGAGLAATGPRCFFREASVRLFQARGKSGESASGLLRAVGPQTEGDRR